MKLSEGSECRLQCEGGEANEKKRETEENKEKGKREKKMRI